MQLIKKGCTSAPQARKAILVRAAQDTREATEEAQVDLEKYVDDLKDKVRLMVPARHLPTLPAGYWQAS